METICSLRQILVSFIMKMCSQELSIVQRGMHTRVSYIPVLNGCALGEFLQGSITESSGPGILDVECSSTSDLTWSCPTNIYLGS